MTFKSGDKVKVRDDLKVNHYYGNDIFTEEMEAFLGRTVTIDKYYEYYKGYHLKEDPGKWIFTKEMLLPEEKNDTIQKMELLFGKESVLTWARLTAFEHMYNQDFCDKKVLNWCLKYVEENM